MNSKDEGIMYPIIGGELPQQRYVYHARVKKVIDGDTLDVLIDLGLHCDRHERLRLLGVNTPEKKTDTKEAGIASQTFVMNWLIDARALSLDEWYLIIRTEKNPDAFGRYLAIVWRLDGKCLNDALLQEGFAVPFRV